MLAPGTSGRAARKRDISTKGETFSGKDREVLAPSIHSNQFQLSLRRRRTSQPPGTRKFALVGKWLEEPYIESKRGI